MQAGMRLFFASREWRVLDLKPNAALIITEDIAELRAYHDVYKDTTWFDCEIRKYLNGDFYDKFNADDRSRIIPVINQNPGNPWYDNPALWLKI